MPKAKTLKKKICYFIGSLQTGGAENHVLQLIEKIDKGKFQVHLCLMSTVNKSQSEKLKITHPDLIVKSFYPKQSFGVFFLPELLRFARYLKVNRINILHIHLVGCFFFASLAGKLVKTPQILITWHSIYTFRFIKTNIIKGITTNLNLLMCRFCCDKIIAVSKKVKDENCKNLNIRHDKVEVIYNGIDVGKKNNLKQIDNNTNFTIGAVGNLYKDKGYIYLLRSIPKLVKIIPNLKVVIIGEGSDRSYLEKYIAKENLESYVDLVGRKNNVLELIQAFDVWIMVSLREGFSLAILEAMSSSLPIIATNVGGNSEAVLHGESGLIINPKNVNDILISTKELFYDKEKRLRLSKNAFVRFKDNFTTQQMMSKLYQCYKNERG